MIETGIAVFALKWLFARVNLFMTIQVWLLAETAATIVTFVWCLSGMSSFMRYIVNLILCTVVAILTLKQLFSCLTACVFVAFAQFLLAFDSAVAVQASKYFPVVFLRRRSFCRSFRRSVFPSAIFGGDMHVFIVSGRLVCFHLTSLWSDIATSAEFSA